MMQKLSTYLRYSWPLQRHRIKLGIKAITPAPVWAVAKKRWHARRRVYLRRKSYALNQLDLKLRPFLNFENGFFIEAGANNGISQSNTLYFEKYRGWHGLLIEPIPELYQACRFNRPHCIVENCALVPPDFTADHVEMYACSMYSFVKGFKPEEEEQRALEAGRKVQGITSYQVTVPTRTLSSVLDAHGITDIGFLSLDLEGYEFGALRGLDLSRHRPRYILIEGGESEEIRALLAPYYKPVTKQPSPYDYLYAAL